MENLDDVIVYVEDCQSPYTSFESRAITEDLDRMGMFNDFNFL